MADHTPNFSCSDPGLSHDSITEEAWMIEITGPEHQPSITALAVLQVIYVLIGVPWNATVFSVILVRRLYKEPTYIFLLNMVIADFLVLIIMPFNIASAFPMKFLIGNSDFARCQVCHTIIIPTLFLTNVSVFIIGILSVDRLIYIKWPFLYKKIISMKSVTVILVVTWLICIVTALPPAFGFGEIKFANPLGSCSLITTGSNRVAPNIVYPLVTLVVIAVPIVAAFVANIWSMTIACRGLKTRYAMTRENTRSATDLSRMERRNTETKFKEDYYKKQFRLVRVFGIIFAVNIITWIPTSFIVLVSAIIGADNISIWWFAFVDVIYLCQPVAHPMLETCLIGKAQKVIFQDVCCCKKKKKKSGENEMSFKKQTSLIKDLEKSRTD